MEDELLCEIHFKVSEIYAVCSEESTCTIREGPCTFSPLVTDFTCVPSIQYSSMLLEHCMSE